MKKCKITTACLLAVMLCLINLVIPVHAEEKWPKMPKVEAPSICVMEISTGTILYEDNMDEVNYPASITKIMAALLALENSSHSLRVKGKSRILIVTLLWRPPLL